MAVGADSDPDSIGTKIQLQIELQLEESVRRTDSSTFSKIPPDTTHLIKFAPSNLMRQLAGVVGPQAGQAPQVPACRV